MAGTINITLKTNPVSGKATSGDWVEIHATGGQNFGGAPNVVHYNPVRLPAGAPIKTTTPIVGTMDSITSGATAVESNGECWIPSRKPALVSDSNENRVNFDIQFLEPFTQFFFFHRTMAQTGKKFPFATTVGGSPVWAQTIMKPCWLTDRGNTSIPDIILPNYNASGVGFQGNQCSIKKQDGTDFNPIRSSSSDAMAVAAPTCFGFYQSGRESSAGARDAVVRATRTDLIGSSMISALADPFYDRNNNMIPPISYEYFVWMGQTNTPASGWTDVQMLINHIYFATGANAGNVLLNHNGPTFATSTDAKAIYAADWQTNGVAFDKTGLTGYFSILKEDGTLYSNLEAK